MPRELRRSNSTNIFDCKKSKDQWWGQKIAKHNPKPDILRWTLDELREEIRTQIYWFAFYDFFLLFDVKEELYCVVRYTSCWWICFEMNQIGVSALRLNVPKKLVLVTRTYLKTKTTLNPQFHQISKFLWPCS